MLLVFSTRSVCDWVRRLWKKVTRIQYMSVCDWVRKLQQYWAGYLCRWLTVWRSLECMIVIACTIIARLFEVKTLFRKIKAFGLPVGFSCVCHCGTALLNQIKRCFLIAASIFPLELFWLRLVLFPSQILSWWTCTIQCFPGCKRFHAWSLSRQEAAHLDAEFVILLLSNLVCQFSAHHRLAMQFIVVIF